jgi:divalent metal cation (Fe/Co/Zn/Cd) transporter
LTQLPGNHVFKGTASIGVGLVLIFVAFQLGTDSRHLLLGEAVPPEDEEHLRKVITSFAEVADVLRLLTMYLGRNAVLVNAEIHVVDGLRDRPDRGASGEDNAGAARRGARGCHTFIEFHPPGRVGQSSARQG